MWPQRALIPLLLGPVFLVWLNERTFDAFSLIALTTASVVWALWVIYSRRWDSLNGAQIVILWVLTRALSLVSGAPSVDDDVYRYLWDGARFINDGTPYLNAPIASFGQPLSPEESWLADGINYPSLPTVYGPLWILGGALGWLLSPTSLIGWKILCIIFEALVFQRAQRWWGPKALVAWIVCPLWFWETMLQCHAELLGVGFFVLALGAIREGGFTRAGFLLALALGGRWSLFPPLLIVALLAKAEGESRKSLILGGALGVGTMGLLLWWMGPVNLGGMAALSSDWLFNPIVWKWFAVRPSMVWVLALGGLLILHRRPWTESLSNLTLWSECFALWLLASTVINPWYFLWLVPGVVVSKERTWWGIWLAVIPVAYWQAQWVGEFHHVSGLHHHPDAVWWIQVLAILLGGVRGVGAFRKIQRS